MTEYLPEARERIAVLEVQVNNLHDQIKGLREDITELTTAVNTLKSLLDQVKGGRMLLLALLGGGGLVTGAIASWSTFVGWLRSLVT